MAKSNQKSIHELVERIFVAQLMLLAVSTLLVGIGRYTDELGAFWFAFLAGVFGASVALLRRVQKGDTTLADETLRSWITTLMPFLYGGIMASVTYFLFMSKILSGTDGGGLLAMNLFPDFEPSTPEGSRLVINDFLRMRPTTLTDAGKLIVWCFLAGYSESLVTGLLMRLEQGTKAS